MKKIIGSIIYGMLTILSIIIVLFSLINLSQETKEFYIEPLVATILYLIGKDIRKIMRND